MGKHKYYARRIKCVQKNFWFPFESEAVLRETAIATGLTQKEIILQGINLVAAQSQQVAV